MYIDINYRDEIPIVKISGELDMYDSNKMEEAFNSIKSDVDVVIDCSDISFVDSTIIGIFVRFSLSKSKYDSRVALINVKPFFIQLLELAKLKKLFLIYDTVDEFFENINS